MIVLVLAECAVWGQAVPKLDWHPGEGYRFAPVTPSGSGAGFALIPIEHSGLRFTNDIAYDRAEANQNLLNGAGVAAGDFDGDGWCDLYFASSGGGNGLFRNLGGLRFQNLTEQAGVSCANQSSKGVVWADINADRRLDLIVNALGGPNALFVNLGDGRFTNVTTTAGIAARAGGHSIALADVDGDGDLDLYLVNYGENSILRSGGQISVRTVGGRTVVSGRHAQRVKIIDGQIFELGEPDVLYLNDGTGVFTAVPWTSGAFLDEQGQPLKTAPWDLGLSALFRDMNGDGAPDLYVCNDFQTPDRIWLNDGRGRFRAPDALAFRSTCHFSMGVDFADINRDGLDDFFVGDMLSRFHSLRLTQLNATNPPPAHVGQNLDRHQIRRNTLFLNRGDGTYADIANFADVAASDWSWSVAFLDVDLDGFEDLLVATAHAYDTQDLDVHEKAPPKTEASMRGMIPGKRLRDFPPLLTPNYAFRNRHDLTFEEVGGAWGFNSTNVSHGIALADLDNDGDMDVVVSCLGKPPLLYRNESPAPRVAVRLRGKASNAQGIGAKIKVTAPGLPAQQQEVHCGGRYLSADDPMRVFAAGSHSNRVTIEVTWRSGARSLVKDVPANHVYEIDESGAVSGSISPALPGVAKTLLFEDVSHRLDHQHEDMPFDDLQRQPLLHQTFSRLGPGVAWVDLDGDGHDECVVGAGKAGRLAVFGSDGKGNFRRWSGGALDQPVGGDLTGLVGWVPGPNQRALLAGLSTYEGDPGIATAVLQYDVKLASGAATLTAGRRPVSTPGGASVGPLCVGDLDGDGDLDVFIGGRIMPGRYPEAVPSLILRNEGGELKGDAANTQVLDRIGLVSGAVFSDLTGDGFPELILACEWGPVRIFRNNQGRLTPWNPPAAFPTPPQTPAWAQSRNQKLQTLNDFTGWWNGVTTGDFDGDGRMDIAASNWGLNSSYQFGSQGALLLYHGDFDGDGTIDLIEAYTDPASQRIVQRRDLGVLGAAMPGLRARFPSHAAFSKADVSAVLGGQLSRAGQQRAAVLSSMVFLNRGDQWLAIPLPAEAQFAPAFGLNVVDFDGDGHQDLFLSQNFFGVRNEEPRCDAGRGLWLRGDGQGGFHAVPGQESGVRIYGEQRGSAVADFDGDGREDLAVAQNSSETKLFRNTRGNAGWRVRLKGPPLNPQGIGAMVRLTFGDRHGPAREVHGGSGYWSQDGAVKVLCAPQSPAGLWVRWPGGRTRSIDLPPNAREVVVPFE